MPQLPTLRDRSMVYGTAAIDCNGRVAEATVINALGWVPGTRLNIRESGGLVLVTADHHGVFTMTTRGHPRLVDRLGADLPSDATRVTPS